MRKRKPQAFGCWPDRNEDDTQYSVLADIGGDKLAMLSHLRVPQNAYTLRVFWP